MIYLEHFETYNFFISIMTLTMRNYFMHGHWMNIKWFIGFNHVHISDIQSVQLHLKTSGSPKMSLFQAGDHLQRSMQQNKKKMSYIYFFGLEVDHK